MTTEFDSWSSASRCTIYIPTWSRFEQCLSQVQSVHEQVRSLSLPGYFRIVVAVNGDGSYDVDRLLAAGADEVIWRPINLGGNANIALGFEQFAFSEFVWILSDDDAIAEGGIKLLVDALEAPGGSDLVVLADVDDSDEMSCVTSIDQLDIVPLSYVSSALYGREMFLPHVENAFRGIITFFPHAFIIQSAISAGCTPNVRLVPLSRVVNLDQMRSEAKELGRSAMGARTGAFFFGGAIAEYLEPRLKVRRHRTRRWWRRHWHRLSMYRKGQSVEGKVVDQLGRSNVFTFPWWLASLPPWWRLKDVLQRLGWAGKP